MIKSLLPAFLPYTTQSKESNVDELAMELMLLLVILPAVQDQNQGREWLKFLVRQWCQVLTVVSVYDGTTEHRICTVPH